MTKETEKDKWSQFDDNAELPEEPAATEPLLADDQEVELTEAEKKYRELEEKWTKASDEAIRLRAEMENIRRRAAQQVEDAHKFSSQKFVEHMLSVLDGFEGALQGDMRTDETSKHLVEGLKMTFDLFMNALQKCGVKEIAPAPGEPFNPQWHEAMSMMQSPDLTPNSVIQVLRKGYELHGRLIRAAMVVVNKG